MSYTRPRFYREDYGAFNKNLQASFTKHHDTMKGYFDEKIKERELYEADINALRAVVRDHRSLRLRFVGIGNFPNGTIYLGIEKTPRLTLLIRKIFEEFPDTPPYGGEFPDPMPHLTVAKSSEEKPDELMQEISAVWV